MQATEKLYFTDSSILQFDARVVHVDNSNGTERVVLDRTAFYPTGGGQPYDTGKLNDVTVLDVIEDDSGIIYHVVNESGQLQTGQQVTGAIDKARRLDHMQQHSGQHILSQAFIQACGADTASFHLGSESSTIDVLLPTATDNDMRAAEEIADAIVFENRPMYVHLFNSEDDLSKLPLRKDNAGHQTVRVIEVADFDWSPCGGTHARQTGEIGLIVIKGFERVGQMTRVEFLCGHRALQDYRLAHQTAVEIARQLSVGREGAPELVTKTIEENKALKKRMRSLLELAMTAEAAQLLNIAEEQNGFRLIKAIFNGRDIEEVRMLASKIAQHPSAIALLATKDETTARLVFSRSANLTQNMGQLLSQACQMLGGRGGGKSDMAQGGGADISKLEAAMNQAAEGVLKG